jgi:hypothetical protein
VGAPLTRLLHLPEEGIVVLGAGHLSHEPICQGRKGFSKRIAPKAVISDFLLRACGESPAPAAAHSIIVSHLRPGARKDFWPYRAVSAGRGLLPHARYCRLGARALSRFTLALQWRLQGRHLIIESQYQSIVSLSFSLNRCSDVKHIAPALGILASTSRLRSSAGFCSAKE